MSWIISIIAALAFTTVVFVVVWPFTPKGWRTMAVNAVSGTLLSLSPFLMPVLEQISAVPWNQVVDLKTAVIITLCINIANGVLRAKTDTALGEKF